MLSDLESGFPSFGRALPYPAAATATDRLALTIFLAIVIHVLVILGVTFVPQERERTKSRSIEVILVQERSPSVPEETRYFAQADQQGADRSPERSASLTAPARAPASRVQASLEAAPAPPSPSDAFDSPVPPATSQADEAKENDSTAGPPASPLSRTALSRDHKTPDRVPKPSSRALPRVESPLPESTPIASGDEAGADDPSAASLRARAMEDLSADIDQRLQAYEEWPRHKWITARAREHAYAAYMEEWRREVERIGNLNYPQEARRHGLSGSLSLDVALNPDGTVAEILLRRSSGEKVLDEAAVRIVLLAAPFAEFPPSMRDETDILHIERTWQFSSRNRFNSR